MAALTDLLNEEFEKAELPMLKGTLALARAEHLSQYKVPNLPADEPAREADFYLPGAELLIEVSQNHEKGSGTRKENYLSRKSLKVVQYERAGHVARLGRAMGKAG